MTKRVIEISSGPLRISVKHHQLILTYPDDQQKQINTEDIGMLILDHPGVTFNVAVVNQLLDCGGFFSDLWSRTFACDLVFSGG